MVHLTLLLVIRAVVVVVPNTLVVMLPVQVTHQAPVQVKAIMEVLVIPQIVILVAAVVALVQQDMQAIMVHSRAKVEPDCHHLYQVHQHIMQVEAEAGQETPEQH